MCVLWKTFLARKQSKQAFAIAYRRETLQMSYLLKSFYSKQQFENSLKHPLQLVHFKFQKEKKKEGKSNQRKRKKQSHLLIIFNFLNRKFYFTVLNLSI